MLKKITKNSNQGLTLVEVLMATSIVLIFIISVFVVNNTFLRSSFANTNAVKATFLAEEGLEAMRFLRNDSWSVKVAPLVVGTNYYLVFASNYWQTTTTVSLLDGIFDRKTVLSQVYRDANGDIVSSGGILDPDTKLITVTISWPVGSTTASKVVSTYLSNLYDN